MKKMFLFLSLSFALSLFAAAALAIPSPVSIGVGAGWEIGQLQEPNATITLTKLDHEKVLINTLIGQWQQMPSHLDPELRLLLGHQTDQSKLLALAVGAGLENDGRINRGTALGLLQINKGNLTLFGGISVALGRGPEYPVEINYRF